MERELDDESGAPAGCVLAPDPAAVQPDMFGHQGEAESGPLARCPVASPATAVEALEEVVPLHPYATGASSGTVEDL